MSTWWGPVHLLLIRCEGQAVSKTAMHAVLVVIGNQPIENIQGTSLRKSNTGADLGKWRNRLPWNYATVAITLVSPHWFKYLNCMSKYSILVLDTEPQIAPDELAPCMAASVISVWMGECMYCTALWAVIRLEKHYKNADHLHKTIIHEWIESGRANTSLEVELRHERRHYLR